MITLSKYYIFGKIAIFVVTLTRSNKKRESRVFTFNWQNRAISFLKPTISYALVKTTNTTISSLLISRAEEN